MVKRKQADGSTTDDAPAPVPVQPPAPVPVQPPVDEATTNEDDKDEDKAADNSTDQSETSAVAGKGSGTSEYDKAMNEMIAEQLKLGSEFGEKVREMTGISKVTGAAEALITTPIKAAVAVVQAAPKAILYTAPKAAIGAMANTIMGRPSNDEIASKLPTPKPSSGTAQDEEKRLEEQQGRRNGPGNGA